MSLLRLLTAGKTLVGLQNVTSRYRVRNRFLLPKFGGIEDPFASPASASTGSAAPTPVARVERYQMSPAELAAARLKETKKIPAAPSVPARTSPAAAAAGPRPLNASWMRRLNPWVWWQRRRDATGKSANTKLSRTPVQCELSLDRVKVVRNDLSDADVEIVPVKPAAKAPPRPVVREEIEALNTD